MFIDQCDLIAYTNLELLEFCQPDNFKPYTQDSYSKAFRQYHAEIWQILDNKPEDIVFYRARVENRRLKVTYGFRMLGYVERSAFFKIQASVEVAEIIKKHVILERDMLKSIFIKLSLDPNSTFST